MTQRHLSSPLLGSYHQPRLTSPRYANVFKAVLAASLSILVLMFCVCFAACGCNNLTWVFPAWMSCPTFNSGWALAIRLWCWAQGELSSFSKWNFWRLDHLCTFSLTTWPYLITGFHNDGCRQLPNWIWDCISACTREGPNWYWKEYKD